MARTAVYAAMFLLTAFPLAAPASAQTNATVRVTRPTGVLEYPRGDSMRVGTVQAGEIYEVLGRRESWLLVAPPETGGVRPAWTRGWIHMGSVEVASGSLEIGTPGAAPRPRGPLMVRGFGQTGSIAFDARDSFDTLIGRTFGLISGAGGQVVLPNGTFAQVSFERFREVGSRVLVAGQQYFVLDESTQITVTPILGTVGYRSPGSTRLAPYVGAGLGWHTLREESPSLPSSGPIKESKIGYHVLGGLELPIARFLSLAGEAQYAWVPKALGDTGLSAIFGEEDLGGATFRFKVVVGY